MRDYFSSAKNAVTSLRHSSNTIALSNKRRPIAYAISAVFLIAVVSALIVIRAAGADVQKDNAATDSKSTTQTNVTTVADNAQPVAATKGGNAMDTKATSSDGSSSSQSQTQTSVSVNNQQIPVPQNGSVTKTVQNGNGTTTVNVTSSNGGGSDPSSGSTTTTLNVNTSTHSDTRNVNVNNNSTQ